MTPFLKSLLGIGLAGGGAGLSVGGYYLLKSSDPKTLAEKFKNKGITVLDYESASNPHNEDWNTKLNDYKSNTTAANDKFSGLTINSGAENDGLQKLKDKCKEYLEKDPKEINEEGLEDKIKRWCTKTTSQP